LRHTATLQITGGMTFGDFNPADNLQEDWWTTEITFTDCDHGTTDEGTEFTGVPVPSFQDNFEFPPSNTVYNVRNELNGSLAGQITITPQGAVTGAVLLCNVEGFITVPDSNFNQFEFSADYDGCGTGMLLGAGTTSNGAYNAFLVDESEGLGFLFVLEPE